MVAVIMILIAYFPNPKPEGTKHETPPVKQGETIAIDMWPCEELAHKVCDKCGHDSEACKQRKKSIDLPCQMVCEDILWHWNKLGSDCDIFTIEETE